MTTQITPISRENLLSIKDRLLALKTYNDIPSLNADEAFYRELALWSGKWQKPHNTEAFIKICMGGDRKQICETEALDHGRIRKRMAEALVVLQRLQLYVQALLVDDNHAIMSVMIQAANLRSEAVRTALLHQSKTATSLYALERMFGVAQPNLSRALKRTNERRLKLDEMINLLR